VNCLHGSLNCFRIFRAHRLLGRSIHVSPSVRSSVRPFVTSLVNTILRKRMNRFCSKLAQVVNWARGLNDQLLGSGGQSSESRDVEVRFGHLTEASFSTLLSSTFSSFYRMMLCIARTMPSVCPSITRRYSVETAKQTYHQSFFTFGIATTF